jgi:type IV secretory pathway TraG/TraD family ATPase VirD4
MNVIACIKNAFHKRLTLVAGATKGGGFMIPSLLTWEGSQKVTDVMAEPVKPSKQP